MSGIVSNRRRVTRRRDDRTPLLSFVSENRFNQRLRKVEEDAEVRELELDYEAEREALKCQYRQALNVIAMRAGLEAIELRRSLAKSDPYIDDKLRMYEEALHLGNGFAIVNAFD